MRPPVRIVTGRRCTRSALARRCAVVRARIRCTPRCRREEHGSSHDRKVPDCPAAGETPLHRLLKGMLADAMRAAGWGAAVEATPGSGDVGGWRADVLAVDATTRRRAAFEVQCAPLTIADARSRIALQRRRDPDDLAEDACRTLRLGGALLPTRAAAGRRRCDCAFGDRDRLRIGEARRRGLGDPGRSSCSVGAAEPRADLLATSRGPIRIAEHAA